MGITLSVPVSSVPLPMYKVGESVDGFLHRLNSYFSYYDVTLEAKKKYLIHLATEPCIFRGKDIEDYSYHGMLRILKSWDFSHCHDSTDTNAVPPGESETSPCLQEQIARLERPVEIHGRSLCFEMKKVRGHCVIFNMVDFEKSTAWKKPPLCRTGSDQDVVSLRGTFEPLGYRVTEFRNQKKKQVHYVLTNLENYDHSQFDSLIICFLTHGNREKLAATNGWLQRLDIMERFDNCTSLAGKPKWFIVQACYGDYLDEGVLAPGRSVDTIDALSQRTIPIKSEVLSTFASYPDHVAFKSTDGSWFIQDLCRNLNAHHKELDVMSIITITAADVAQRVSYCPQKKEHNMKQIPYMTSTLTKILWLRAPSAATAETLPELINECKLK